jgi:hypothetical protein
MALQSGGVMPSTKLPLTRMIVNGAEHIVPRLFAHLTRSVAAGNHDTALSPQGLVDAARRLHIVHNSLACLTVVASAAARNATDICRCRTTRRPRFGRWSRRTSSRFWERGRHQNILFVPYRTFFGKGVYA